MSGWGHHYNQALGRGGNKRTGQRSYNTKYNKPKSNTKKTLQDYSYYLGSIKQAADFDHTTKFIINYIRSTYEFGDDVPLSLENYQLKDFEADKPTLKILKPLNEESTPEEIEEYETLKTQTEIEYKSDLDDFKRQKLRFKTNLIKVYGLLWGWSIK